ncbi:MAG: hypothetical protein ACYC8T_30900 [Myxococcaceae bacterium]
MPSYPSLDVVRGLERSTLRTISETPEFAQFPELQGVARGWRTLIPPRGGVSLNLHLFADIRLRADKRKDLVRRRIDIGARVDANADGVSVANVSYSLLLCKAEDPRKSPMVRKIHFDFEPVALRNMGEAKPSAHMQVCGKLAPSHIDAGYSEARIRHWYPDFEKPRIPCAPMSLALLLNWLMLEFDTDKNFRAIQKHARWRNLVAETERAMLLPYYSSAAQFLGATVNQRHSFVETHLYGT